jgi:type VII secretion-associated serine protease mycosin
VTPVTDAPWAQRHYDLAALAQQSEGAGTTVAVIDSGVDASHPQLREAVRPGADMLVRGGDGREDCVGHGTAVASVIAARPVAGVAFQGVAPAVSILPVRVSERTEIDGAPGEGDIRDLAAGIRAATSSEPKPAVINLSISTTTDHPELRAAVEQALAADIVLVAAVGNNHERGNPTPYPAAYDGVLGVGAIGPDGLRLAESQAGSYVDIVAPGDGIVAAAPGGGHMAFEGTSLAVPFVAATAALIRARYPGLGQADVVRRLLATADPAPGSRPSPEYGYGVLNPARALTEVLIPPVPGAAAAPLAAGPDEPGAARAPAVSTTLLAASVLVTASMVILATAAALPSGRRRRWRPGVVDDVPTLLGPPQQSSGPPVLTGR